MVTQKRKVKKYSIYFIIGLLWYLFLSLSVTTNYFATFNITKESFTNGILFFSLIIILWASIDMYIEYKANKSHPLIIGGLLIVGGVTGIILGQILTISL